MKVVLTAAALADLDEALDFTRRHFPQSVGPFQRRILATIERISRWPRSAREVEERPGVRVVPLNRFPYRVFYRVTDQQIEVLHIHHASRRMWNE